MRRRWLVVAAGGLTGALVVVPALGAHADAPAQAGWWTSANPGSLPIAPPAPPDVPTGGLMIEGGASSASGSGDASPTAFAAVTYNLDSGATVGSLTLTVAANSASTPNTTVELCPLTDSFTPEDGGAMSDAPTFSCATNVTAAVSSSGGTYTFTNVSSLVSNGSLSVAILPTAPTDRVVFDAPDQNSLAVTESTTSSTDSSSSGSDSAGAALGSSDSSSSPVSSGDLSPATPVASSGDSSSIDSGSVSIAPVASAPDGSAATSSLSPAPSLSPATSGTGSAPSTASAGSSPAAAQNVALASTSSGSKVNGLLAFLLIAGLAVAGVLWRVAGQSSLAGGPGGPGAP